VRHEHADELDVAAAGLTLVGRLIASDDTPVDHGLLWTSMSVSDNGGVRAETVRSSREAGR
jgi:hypothetical protein